MKTVIISKKARFVRSGRNITDITKETPVNIQHKSRNKAKKESWKIQMKLDGALGRGSVQTV